MPDFGSIGGSMNSIGLTTGYTNVGAVTRTPLDGTSPAARRAAPDSASRSSGDRVEVSDHARFMEQLRAMPAVRADKVAAIKSAIEAGTYDTDEKLSLAFERMLVEVDGTDE